MGEAQAAARTLGLEVVRSEIRRAEDIARAFEALKGVAQALYVCPDATINANHARIYTLALGARLPTMHGLREYVEAGQPVWRPRTLCSACQQRAQRGRLGRVSRIYFRTDAAFAMPEVYEFLEAERIKYAIRLPANQVLQSSIGYLLTRPVGRPPHHVRRFHANFSYQAGTWTKPRRVIAKVEWRVAIPRQMFQEILRLIAELRPQPAPALA